MIYKYIGTEEQLIEHDFEMEKVLVERSTPLIHGTRRVESLDTEIYIVLSYGNYKPKTYEDDTRRLQWNDDYPADIAPHIQDLIEAGLVEIIE